jgi:branched-chain amino acid transport system ATP-binding protein
MLLEARDLTAFYGDFQALFGVNITLDEGETIAIIGANGAGKTTLLRSLSGVLGNAADMVRFEDNPIGNLPADELVARGIAMVPEGRKLFPSLSVEENLLIGAYSKRAGKHWNLEAVYELFPILREKSRLPSTSLSGGQQQMVAIGRALMSNPRVLLCDEISLGLAPVVIKDIYANMPKIKATGASIVIVEQDVGQALKVADRVYCMMEGRISLSGRPSEITRDAVHAAYFGAAA